MLVKRELRVNLGNFIIWFLIAAGMFALIFLLYPYIIEGNNGEMIDDMIKIFPESVLKAFNMDIASLDSAFGWLKSEGFVFILLITGCYSAILGSNIILKEENDKTIEYLNSLPISRSEIVIKKFLVGLFYVVMLVLLTAISNYIFLALTSDIKLSEYWLLAISPLFSSIVLYALSILIASFMHKSKKMMGISLGIVFISYFLNMFAGLSEKIEFFKYFSIFTLADTRNIIANNEMSIIYVFIAIILTAIFALAALFVYNKKELV